MSKRFAFIGLLCAVLFSWTACKNDVTNTGESVLDESDKIIIFADTFSISSAIDSCNAIISQPDSFLLGELETDYGLLRASILTQLACPEGYHYPADVTVDSIDSICLFMYYGSWVGDAKSPMAINAYMMDRGTFSYSGTYPTNLSISDFCSRDKSILVNHSIVVASEMRDSIKNSNGVYIPALQMRVNDDFMRYFGSILSFESQDKFDDQFNGLLIESSFGSSTVLNISDIALGVYYHFGYKKAGRDTIVHDLKVFYANSEVRTVNHLEYRDKKEWIEKLQQDSNSYNYIIAPAGAYTRLSFPLKNIKDSIMKPMIDPTTLDTIKRAYVNKAEVRVSVENVYSGIAANKQRNDWLQPSTYMLLVKEESMDRFFAKKELPSDTCALLSPLTQGTDSTGSTIYYYSYDLSDFITNQLRKESGDKVLDMLMVPVSVGTTTTSSATAVSSVRQQQTMSATKIRSAKNGMQLEIVYSGF